MDPPRPGWKKVIRSVLTTILLALTITQCTAIDAANGDGGYPPIAMGAPLAILGILILGTLRWITGGGRAGSGWIRTVLSLRTVAICAVLASLSLVGNITKNQRSTATHKPDPPFFTLASPASRPPPTPEPTARVGQVVLPCSQWYADAATVARIDQPVADDLTAFSAAVSTVLTQAEKVDRTGSSGLSA